MGRSPGGGNGNPLQYSCLENPIDRGAWRATVHRVGPDWSDLARIHNWLRIFFSFGCTLRPVGSYENFPQQGWTPHPMQWKLGVLTTPSPGKSFFLRLKKLLWFPAFSLFCLLLTLIISRKSLHIFALFGCLHALSLDLSAVWEGQRHTWETQIHGHGLSPRLRLHTVKVLWTLGLAWPLVVRQRTKPKAPAAAATAKSLQSCPTLWDPIDSSPPGSAIPGILQARTLEWVAIFFSIAWKLLGEVQTVKSLLATQETRVQSLGREDPVENEMATHSCVLTGEFPRTEEPGRL